MKYAQKSEHTPNAMCVKMAKLRGARSLPENYAPQSIMTRFGPKLTHALRMRCACVVFRVYK
jgi:hypothetical protein